MADTHQVLARKWRPRSFDQLVGQEHVVRALSNALSQQRLHHAYLFTGTRGVGKTTLARILAKSLNCETGITATPCGTCSACTEIDAGRYVDLIELDAASNTQVDNMRELLENALYAPTAGRYKVYIIDEVHMLSRNAFNAMLKTLEEPPAHVKFILATTDPQKIPVTVLSRCLQFSLKQIPHEQIRERLQAVLTAENIQADTASLSLIARAAEGSLRDALSLLDQAIAHGGGILEEGSTRAMLGAVDQGYLFALLEALSAGDGGRLMGEAEAMAARSLSFDAALQALATLLHRLSVIKVIPDYSAEDEPDAGRMQALAEQFSADALQLHYQIAVQGRHELAWAPDEFTGFTMTLLRMLAFAPVSRAAALPVANQAQERVWPEKRERRELPGDTVPDVQRARGTVASDDAALTKWPALVGRLGLNAMAHQLALRCELVGREENGISLRISKADERLFDKPYRDRLTSALRGLLGKELRVIFSTAETVEASPKAIIDRERAREQDAAEKQMRKDPFVQELLNDFGGALDEGSIRPKGLPDKPEKGGQS